MVEASLPDAAQVVTALIVDDDDTPGRYGVFRWRDVAGHARLAAFFWRIVCGLLVAAGLGFAVRAELSRPRVAVAVAMTDLSRRSAGDPGVPADHDRQRGG